MSNTAQFVRKVTKNGKITIPSTVIEKLDIDKGETILDVSVERDTE